MNQLSELSKAFRDQNFISQKELGSRTKVSQKTISRIEQGEKVSFTKQNQVARVVDTSFWDPRVLRILESLELV